jgi:hypothetical protein
MRAGGDQNILEASIISTLACIFLPPSLRRAFFVAFGRESRRAACIVGSAHLQATRPDAYKDVARKPKCPENVSIKKKDIRLQSNIGWLCPVGIM